ncbi:phosphoserine aminotransferase [Humitalea rosea]|uniref:Phosphoserine aminotransferase n=1 Tax=Humitalea rosea TaxID=990373 RepID=A0A2W7IEY3_9PROT|nr:phosphoserine transaminase [Humitalea rosea]PZW43665.1 phosphoserine aminotransferase [Humitalea rosea]
MPKPLSRPANPCFSSGPCAKRPGWSLAGLDTAMLGRSHRAAPARARLAEVIERSKAVLGMPEGWRLGIVPASDTGAVEMALWSLLGPRPVDVVAFESFGETWAADILKHLRLPARRFACAYGELPDLAAVDWAHDVVFPWNGTTSGVRIPNGDWIAPDREGLAICDATSAAFAMALPWDRLDVVTWSWQKVLGGEAAHGMLALSPRAVERLTTHTPAWPLPKIFRLTSGAKLIEGIFAGDTINTPSMLCVEDALDGLRWAEAVGGVPGLVARSEANLATIAAWIAAPGSGFGFLARTPLASISPTSICIAPTTPGFRALMPEAQAGVIKRMAALLEAEHVAYDIAGYRDAPPSLRIWGGATVETTDIAALLPWLDWALTKAA